MHAPACKPAATVAPGQAGDFEREGSRFNPQPEHARAGFRHALRDHPQIRFNVHVDPGRWRRPPRAGAAWQAFRQHLPLAAKPGTCTQLRELRQGTFPLTTPETGDTPPAHAIDPAVLTARAEAGQPAGHKPQLGMRLPPPDWPPDFYGYRFYKQFN
ncbi:hypothetical protein [Stenotrophomonas acidaminiphila]|uniref:hypothetical protein n=1 Tax=Stenotrophomonas acidaminiphila TaxID=128780 RepID=UPI0028A5DAF1|nr:hypothetical protein [Stenotrophomonas acidaminiphila]